MMPNAFFGVLLHAVGGLAAGSFYIPFKKVRQWSWESYWIVGGFFSWIIAPWVVAYLACPQLMEILHRAAWSDIGWCFLFGALWGIGGLTFGLSMRYLGMSLGYAISLGFCATFGTLIPALFDAKFASALKAGTGLGDLLGIVGGNFSTTFGTGSGLVTLGGIAVCIVGIVVCGWAGVRKERELPGEKQRASIREFSFVKGVCVAVFAGIMSAFMAFAIAAGKPIADCALQCSTHALCQDFPVLIVILAGGFTTNFLWCVLLNLWNRSGRDYVTGGGRTLTVNYLFSALAGITWYFQFFFYTMGKNNMHPYEFSSWTIHMAFIIVFSNLWGIYFREWKGSSRRTHWVVLAGIAVLVVSTVIVGAGNYLAPPKP